MKPQTKKRGDMARTVEELANSATNIRGLVADFGGERNLDIEKA